METNPQFHQRSFRALLWPLGVLLMIFVALAAIQKGYDLRRAIKNDQPQNTIAISAEGKVKAVPDTAVVTLGVLAQGRTTQAVQNDAAAKINAITEFVKSQGVNKEDITTSQASLNPQYDYTSGRNTITGYQSNQTITVKVRGIDRSTEIVGNILAGAVEHGANEVYGAQFTFDDPDALRQEARKMAIEKAKEKAQDLARVAGLSLGKVVSIAEAGSSFPPGPIPYAADAIMGRGLAMPEKSLAPSVEPGSQDITEHMTVVFELK